MNPTDDEARELTRPLVVLGTTTEQEKNFLSDAVKGYLRYGNTGYLAKMSLRRVVGIIKPTQEYTRQEAIEIVSLVALDADEIADLAADKAEAVRSALARVVATIEGLPPVEYPQ